MSFNPAALLHGNYSSGSNRGVTSHHSEHVPLSTWLSSNISSQLVVKVADFDHDGDLDYQCLDYRGLNVSKGDDFAPFSTRPCYMCRCDRIERNLLHGLMCDEKFCPSCLSLARPAYDACCAKTCIYMYVAGAAILSMLVGLCLFGLWQNMRRWRGPTRLQWLLTTNNATTSPVNNTAGATTNSTTTTFPVLVFHNSDGSTNVHPNNISTLRAVYSTTVETMHSRHQPNYAAFTQSSSTPGNGGGGGTTAAVGAIFHVDLGNNNNNNGIDELSRQAPPSYWSVLSSDRQQQQASGSTPDADNSNNSRHRKPDATSSRDGTLQLKRSESPPPKYDDLVLDDVDIAALPSSSTSSRTPR